MIVEATQIEQVFRPIVGLPLSDMTRFAGWQRLEFGPQKPFVNRKGQEVTRADYALHVVCDWRIVGPAGIIVGSDDYGPARERRDEKAVPFFHMPAETPPIVQSIRADAVGSLYFTMTGGYSLDILPMGASPEEHWILLPPGAGSYTLDEHGFGA